MPDYESAAAVIVPWAAREKEELRRGYNKLPSFPPSKWLNAKDKKFIDKRAVQIAQWLNDFCNNPIVLKRWKMFKPYFMLTAV